ncbi:O-antigen ligase family protein [Ruania suaedae]|uniref:O-antigen ligase family protein n=1 Tax=Ruania suaedae TaxID=2897774 RepID=UPI001E42B066|nr:O-antigen ligase family protein [Ruania suaedae]UFU02384.1 O-antigen ligase family protein [Ruania suaedae]
MAGPDRRVEAPGSPRWQPILLRIPAPLLRAREEWVPVLIRGGTITTLGLLALFLALQFLIPARLVIGGMGAVGRPSVAIGILLAFLWVVSAIRPHHLPAGRQPIRWAVGVFLAVQLVGHVVGFDRLPTAAQASAADRWLILMAALCGVTLAVADGIRTRGDLDRLLRLLVVFACAMSLVGALQFFAELDLTRAISIPGLVQNYELIHVGARGDGDFPRVAGTANHYIEFGVVLALVLPVAMHYALFSPPGHSRMWRWSAVGLIALGIPLSISRSAIVTVFVVMVLMAIIWPWRQRYNAAVIGVLATGAFHVLNRGVLGTIRGLFTNAENDPSVLARIERTATVLELWRDRPLLGWGAGMVTPEEFLLLDNQVYMFLIAGGVIGVAGFLVFFVLPYLLGRSIRLRGRDQETRHLGHTLAVTMPAAVVASATFDSFSFATFVGVMCVLIGATGALWRLDGTSVARPLQLATPGDTFVTTPLMAQLRRRLRAAWMATRPRHYGRTATRSGRGGQR